MAAGKPCTGYKLSGEWGQQFDDGYSSGATVNGQHGTITCTNGVWVFTADPKADAPIGSGAAAPSGPSEPVTVSTVQASRAGATSVG